MSRGLRLPSGRVIAIGRFMLAALFLLAIGLDLGLPGSASMQTYVLLAVYLTFALWLLVSTWSDWWIDAKLAGPAHAIDIIAFALLVMSAQGDTSRYLTFFMFVLLSAAIRWSWRTTALTAVLMTLLYLLAGMVVPGTTPGFGAQSFIIRTGHLVILSLVLIWFGVNQWRSSMYVRDTTIFTDPELENSPLETSLRTITERLTAARGALVWRGQSDDDAEALVISNGDLEVTRFAGEAFQDGWTEPFLYDLRRDRALARDESGNLRAYRASQIMRSSAAKALKLDEGLGVPLRTGAGEGELFLEKFTNLSIDHLDLGKDVAADVVGRIERHALMMAVEESAEARSRLSLARDLHDSVVQFLAGAAFRLEALKRDQASGRDIEGEINQLKQHMLQEQDELRSFIAALRSAPKIGLDDLAKDLRSLSSRLARQWDVFCEFSADTADVVVPTRLQRDVQHLMREAVANAVRHAGAKTMTIRLRAESDELVLDFINDGRRYPKSPLTGELPKSLSERVKLAGGAFELTRGMGVTKISVSLPIGGRLH